MRIRSIGTIVLILCVSLLFLPPVLGALPDVTVQHHAFARTSEEWEYLGDHITGTPGGGPSVGDREIQFRDYSMALEAYRASSQPHNWQYYAHVSSLERKLADSARGLADTVDDPVEQSLWETFVTNADRASDRDAARSTTLLQEDRSTFGCLIVTAAYGSPLAAEVQLVRDFRDGTLRQTYAGSRFFTGFNAWYYSFSPAVADYIASHPAAKSFMQVYLLPLLEIVLLSRNLAAALWFSPEIATICVLVFGAASYGLVYIFPAAFSGAWLAMRRGWNIPAPAFMKPVLALWILTLAGLAAGIVLSVDLLTVISSGLLVAGTAALVAGTGTLVSVQYLERNRAADRQG